MPFCNSLVMDSDLNRLVVCIARQINYQTGLEKVMFRQ